MLFSAEWMQVVYAVGGAVLGWWLKHRSAASPLPAEVVELVQLMLTRRKSQQAEDLLRGLLEAARGRDALAPPAPPEGKKGT